MTANSMHVGELTPEQMAQAYTAQASIHLSRSTANPLMVSHIRQKLTKLVMEIENLGKSTGDSPEPVGGQN